MDNWRNEFGKLLAGKRIEKNLLSMDTAKTLGVSLAYLSNVEHGRKKVPQEWFGKLVSHLELSLPEATELKVAMMRSNKAVELEVTTPEEAAVLAAFDLNRQNLTEDRAERLIKAMTKP